MKAALQEAEEAEDEEGEVKKVRDAKGREVLTEEEKTKKEEKEKKKSAEASHSFCFLPYWSEPIIYRKRLRGKKGYRNLLATSNANLGYSPSRPRDQTIPMSLRAGGLYVN